MQRRKGICGMHSETQSKTYGSKNVGSVMLRTIKKQKWLSIGIVCAVVGAILTALLPPLILGNIIDSMTAGNAVSFYLILLYFGFTLLTGLLESAREGLLVVFGQKITHALRSSLMDKYTVLTADALTHQEPGAVVSRFVGDVDTVENLFTSGIISMFADACKIISILAVIWFKNRGLAIVLVVLLPFLFWFTRIVQKNMLAAQIENRRAVSRASGHVPQTLHNIRTIRNLGRENYMAECYDTYIGESYRAMERTNFYDAIYSPVILILNAVVVAVVMLLSASGNANVLNLFGMSAGTAVAVMNYISQIFSPVESLGMEIQTIQSAIAGVHRINEFFCLKELSDKTGYIKENLQKVDINWEQYDLIDNNGNSETMSSNFNDLAKVSEMMILVISVASFVILVLVFLFWLKNRVQEVGIFLSLGVPKFRIIGQIWSEAIMIAVLSLMLSFAVAPAVSKVTANYLVSQQVQQMQEEEKNNEGKVSTEYVAPKQDVQNISVEVTPEMYLLDGASVLVLITASVLVSGIVILKRNPKDILSEMS